MSIYTFSNNYLTTLASPASSSTTTLTFTENPPAVSAGQILPITLNDAATGTIVEIVYATATSGANATVIRGQEGTAAVAWLASDNAYAPGVTAGVLGGFQQTNQPLTSNGPLQFVNLANDSINNFSTFTKINVTSFSLPANSLTLGAKLVLSATGGFSCTGTPTVQFRMNVGSLGAALFQPRGTGTTVTGTSQGWGFVAEFIVLAAGASGILQPLNGYGVIGFPPDQTFANGSGPGGSVNTTIANNIDVYASFSAANVANTAETVLWTVELTYPPVGNVVT